MRSSLLLATVVLMCCISVAQARRMARVPQVTFAEGETSLRFPRRQANEGADKTARGRRLLQQRQDTRSQEMLKNTQEQSRASIMMSPEAVLVEVSEERPHLAGAPVIPETDLEEHELVQATATSMAITLHELGSSCAQAAPYTIWADESSDSQHGNVCFKPGGFKGGGVWACPVGCTKIHSVPWCIDDNDNTAPCRVPEILDPARCSSVVPGQGLQSGSMSCQPEQDDCITSTSSWVEGNEAACKAAWNGVVECPDGISSKGVYFPYALAGWTAQGILPQNVCAKWDSFQILNNQLACDESLMASEGGVYACTKATATHVHHASPASGIMIMKRIRCTTSADSHDDCATFKVGICLDVGSDVFNHKFNGAITDIQTQTKAWLAKALPIVDGTATECTNTDFLHKNVQGLCFKTQSSADEGAQCGQSSAVKWCALSQKDFEDKTNEFGNCGSFCFACGENDEMLTNRRIAAY